MIKENIKFCKDITNSIYKIMEDNDIKNGYTLFPMLRRDGNKLLLGSLVEGENNEVWSRNKVVRPQYWVILDMKDFSLIELNKTSEKDYMDSNIIPLDREFDDEFTLESKNVAKFATAKKIQYKDYLMNDVKNEIINTQNKILDAIDNKIILDNEIIDARDYLIANVEAEISSKVQELVELIVNEKYSAIIYYYQCLIEEIIKEYLDKNTINIEKMKLAATILDTYYGSQYGIKYFFNV